MELRPTPSVLWLRPHPRAYEFDFVKLKESSAKNFKYQSVPRKHCCRGALLCSFERIFLKNGDGIGKTAISFCFAVPKHRNTADAGGVPIFLKHRRKFRRNFQHQFCIQNFSKAEIRNSQANFRTPHSTLKILDFCSAETPK